MVDYKPKSSGVIARAEAGKLGRLTPRTLEILDYLTMYSGDKYTQKRLCSSIRVSAPTCSVGIAELLELDLIREVKNSSGRRCRPRMFRANINHEGNLITEPSLKARLDT